MRHLASRAVLLFAAVLASTETLAAYPDSNCAALVAEEIRSLTTGVTATAAKNFSPELADSQNAARLDNDWGTLLQQNGPYSRHGAPRLRNIGGRTFVFTTLQFSRGSMDAINRCDATGKISYLEWSPTSDASAKIAAAKIRVLQNGVREVPSIVSSPFGPLPATLTLPPGKAPFPVVLMVSGAGANDQDAAVGPNKPFRDLALGLAANGIASLRYDKRVRAYRAESSLAETLTVDDDVTNDATTALQQMGERSAS